jgi:quercetin dioxygenase-like cupin family protein
MTPLLKRRDLGVLAAAVAAAASSLAWAQQAPYTGQGVKPNILLDKELEGFPLQMTRLTLADFGQGGSVPLHNHPAAQEIVYGIDGAVTFDIEGRGTTIVKAGDVLLIPAGVVHTPHSDSSSSRVLFIHSITDKNKPFRVDVKT